MTSAEHAAGRGFLVPYIELFRIHRAWRFSVAGIIARLPMATFGLGTVLLISAGTGRYGVAGSVAASGSLGGAACAPQLARLVDRLGQRRVLVPVVVLFAVSVTGLVAAVQLNAPDWALFLPGILGGATMPQTGPMARARWSALLAGSPRLHTAFSVESVADEVCFVVGPAAVTVLATQLHPAAGVTFAALFSLTGSLWFAAQRETEPPVLPRRAATGSLDGVAEAAARLAGAADPAHAADARAADSARREARAWRGHVSLAAPTLAVLTPAYLFLGAMFVSIDLATIAFSARAGHKALAGFVLGAYALGSGTGGLWYGSRSWHAPIWRRMAVTLTMTVAGVCTFWAMPNLAVLTVVIFICGLTIAPTLISGYSLVESTARPGRTTEAMAWLSTGISVGVACGATAAGFILDGFGPRWGYVFAAVCGVTAAAIYLSGARRVARA